MLTGTIRRWLAALGLAAAVVTACASPAAAAPGEVALYANNAMIAPGGTLRTISVFTLTDEPLPGSTLTIDRGEVDAFAVVEVPSNARHCSESGAVIRCAVVGNPDSVTVHISVSARADARAGQEGELALTLSTPDSGTASYRPTITVGEGVDLVAEESVSLSGRPGALLKAPLTVQNRGEKAARGAVLMVYGPYALNPGRRYENCEYAERPVEHRGHTFFACTFPDVLEPGETARLDGSFGIRIRSDAWAPNDMRGNAFWLTPADWQEYRSIARLPGELGPKGTQGVLTLRTGPQSQAKALPQTDLDPYSNGTAIFLHVEGDQRADLAANGATVTGAVGARVPMTVGFTNNGPAAVDAGGMNWLITMAVVTVPKGTTAVTVPRYCRDATDDRPESWGSPGAAVYECSPPGPFGRGKKAEIAFQLRIDRAGSLTGRVQLRHFSQEVERRDLNPANDTATIRVNPVAGDGGQGGGDDDGGGTLPITGDPTGLIAGIGGLLLAAGMAGFVVARRGRTRFVA